MRSLLRLLTASPLLSSSLVFASVLVSASACSSTPTPPVGSGGSASGGGPGSGGITGSGGAGSGGVVGSGGAATGGGTGTGGASSGGASTGGAASGGAGSGGAGTGGSAPYAFTCPPGSESMTPNLSGTPTALPGTFPQVPGGGITSNAIIEGPVWFNNTLYVSQMRDYGPLNPSQILMHDGSNYQAWFPDSLTNGIALREDGVFVAASHGVGGLVEIDPTATSPNAVTLIADYMGNRLNSPNDLVIRSDGHIYFTDPSWQCGDPCDDQADNRVYHYPAGGGALEAIATGHDQPNGITLSLDGTQLYVGGQSNIEVYTLDGTTGAVTAGPAQFNDVGLNEVDGLSIDCAGNIYVTAGGNLTVLDPDGGEVDTVDVPNATTNVAFGGPSSTTLYITTRADAGVYSLDVGIPGSPY